MPIVALTGGIGSGKTEAAHLFEKLGVPIIDTDVISHQLTGPNQAAIAPIINAFGAEFIDENNALNRAKMRDLVFNYPHMRQKLEAILHPLIRAQVLLNIAKNTARISPQNNQPNAIHYQIIVIPLLFESKQFQGFAHINCVVDCDPATQIKRAMARSQMSEPNVQAIMAAQVSRDSRLKLAHEVIENDGTIEELTIKVNALHKKFQEKCFKLA